MNPLTDLEMIIAAGLLILVGGVSFHVGGLAPRAALEAQHAAQLQAVVDRLDENARQAAADHLHMQGVIDHYDATKNIPDPASVGTAHRLLIVAAAGGGCAVPEAGTVAGGAPDPARVTLGPSRVEQALDDYIQACGHDAKKLTAAQSLAPNPKASP
jgi:hypothetical protein